MLTAGNGLDALALANPWTIESDDAAPLRRRCARATPKSCATPSELWRLVTGKVSFAKLAGGIRQALRPAPAPSGLADEVAAGLAGFGGPAVILLASRDRTAQAFEAGWDGRDPRISRCEGATHAFAEAESRDWLFEQVTGLLRNTA